MKRFAISVPPRVHRTAAVVHNLIMRYFGSIHDRLVAKTHIENAIVGKIAHCDQQEVVAKTDVPRAYKKMFESGKFVVLVSAALRCAVSKTIRLRKAIIAMVGEKNPIGIVARWRILDELDMLILSALDQTKLCDIDYQTIDDIEGGGS